MAGWFPDGWYSEYYAEWFPVYGVATSWTTATRRITGLLEIQWDGATWTDESSRLLSVSGSMGMLNLWQTAGGTAVHPSWTANFQMRNASDRFSATNSGGALYAYIRYNKGHGIPIRFSMGLWNGTSFDYTRLFTGYIDDIQITSTRTDRATFTCVDSTHPLLQRKVTTTMYLDQDAGEWIGVLAAEAGVTFTSLDDGLFIIPFCWCDDENAWTEMCKAAHADGGLLYFDRDGTLTFENAEAWARDARHTTSQHTFDVTRPEDFSIRFDWRQVYNEVVVEAMPRLQSGKALLYELNQALIVLPGATETLHARLRYPSPSIESPAANVDYYLISATGEDVSGSVSVTLTKYAQRVEVVIVNNHSVRNCHVFQFQIKGRPLIGYQAIQKKLQATDSHIGDPTTDDAKTLTVSGNEYIQSADQALFLVSILRDRIKSARNMYSVRNAPAVPTLIPGDRVTVVEAGAGLNNTGYIESISWNYGGGVYHADYEIIDDASWFLYAGDAYFRMGTDTIGSSQRIFY